ncbi:MAG: N-acetylmuramoyl-L-alanine amidase, partial [Deltaproteobacteria bacterium]|nr:N-acetylmuramoyl-L-alanine amidase [Deltaproteobacteria bacterium]
DVNGEKTSKAQPGPAVNAPPGEKGAAGESPVAPDTEIKGPAEAGEAKEGGVKEAPAARREAGKRPFKIVIDPGHGGKDPGAIGKKGLREKDVTLRISRLLKEKLSARLKSRIIATRETDVFIPLEERTAIANSKDADIFVSIHVNASPKRTASGVETYILNISHDEKTRRVAARENATSRKAVTEIEFILNDLIKTAKSNDSSRLASSVHESLVAELRGSYKDTKSNGVKGAPFYVLVGTRMPSILIEVSFISNPSEEKKLRDEKYINDVAEGISSGIIHYINGGAGAAALKP